MPGKILVIGFPKSGTTTLTLAFRAAGIFSIHWRYNGRPVGEWLYDDWFSHGDPFASLHKVGAITQMDYCHPGQRLNYWPNLDLALLLAIRRQHPDTRFILNYRDPDAIASSISRWISLANRLIIADIPGLPAGCGAVDGQMQRWIATHFAAVREIFGGDPNFLELDIGSDTAQTQLSAFLGVDLPWWGVANRNQFEAGDDEAAPAAP